MKKACTGIAKMVRSETMQAGVFKDMPFRLTPQRMMILRLLKGDTSHPNAEGIFNKVRVEYPNISLKTVYNTLDLLNESHIIQELAIESRIKRYCPNPVPHHHLFCTSCKKVVDVFQDIPVRLEKKQFMGFRIDSNQITFRGVCPDCRVEGSKTKHATRR
jgi:Fur family transcriptional regulator, peroxide stress response regulator